MIMHGNKQAGGTLVGIVIGLIIGLSIAVVVAITIKNTPLPFTNKVAKQDKPAGPAQAIDLNKPLYGNQEPAKQAAKDFIKPAEQTPENTATTDSKADVKVVKADVAPGKTDGKLPAADKATLDKLADKSKSAAEEKFTYYLQAGAFREQNDAENTKARLALMGLGASISEKESENGMLYRVRIGPFTELDAVNRVRGKLSDNGVDVAVVRLPR